MKIMSTNYNNSSMCLRVFYRNVFPAIKRIQVGPNNYSAGGIIMDIFRIFASYYNVCYSLTFHDDEAASFGHFDPVNKTYVGSLGDVYRNKQDLMLMGLFGTNDRYKYFDISSYIFITGQGALLGYPTVRPNYAGFLQIFDSVSLIAVGCSFLLGLIMIVISRIITKSGKNFRVREIGKTCGSEFMILFGAFIGQGVVKKRSKHSSRNLLLCMWIFSSLFLNFFYKSQLLSVLVVPKISLPFTNVYEMVEQDEVKWHLLRDRILTREAERSEPNSTLGKMFAKSIGIADQSITPEYLKEVREGKLTIITPDYIIPHTISELMGQNDTCLYTKMKEPFNSLPCFFFMRKGLNATIKTMFSKTVTRLTEAGIVNHLLYKDVRPSVFHCFSSAEKAQKSLKILKVEDFIGIFALLLIGFIIATFVFVLEVLI